MKTEVKPIWYLPGPFYQYNEDVKALAKAAGVVIVDANVTADRSNAAEDVPTVTLKADGAPAEPVRVLESTGGIPTVSPTVAASVVDLGDGRTTTTAELEAKAIELSGLTPGKFKQLKKPEREAFVLMALAAAKGG